MAHGTVEFFNPTCPITVGTDWDFQTCGPKQTATNYANELGQHGDELRHATHGKKTSWSWTFVNNKSSDAITIPKAGLVSAGWHVDSIQISWGRDQIKPKMTVNAHMHEDGTNHAENSCRTYTATVAIDAVAFGVPADLGAVARDARRALYTGRCAVALRAASERPRNGRRGRQRDAGRQHDACRRPTADRNTRPARTEHAPGSKPRLAKTDGSRRGWPDVRHCEARLQDRRGIDPSRRSPPTTHRGRKKVHHLSDRS